MKLTIDSKELLNAFKHVQPAVKDNAIIPVMKSVLIESNDGLVKVTGTSEEMTIIHELVCEGAAEAKFLLTYIDAFRILEAIEGECTITIAKGAVEITSGDNVYKLGESTDSKLFPSVPEKEHGFSVEVSGDFFHSLKLASKNTYTMYNNMVDICNVFIDFNPDNILIFSCDQGSAFIKTIPAKAEKKQIVILPDLLKPLLKFQDSELYVDDKRLHVTHNRTTVILRLSEAKEIDILKYKSFENPHNFHSSREELMSALNKVLVYETMAPIIDLKFNEGALYLDYTDHLLNKSARSSTIIKGSEERKITLNGKRLREIVQYFSQETTQLNISVSSEKENMSISSTEEEILTFIQPLI